MPTNQFSVNMNNCVFIDPQIQLGAALANSDLHEFKSALDNGAIPTTLDSKNNTVFDTALQTYGRAAFVEECLRHGTSPNFNNHHYNKAAINFAVDSRDPEILHTLLKHEGVNVNRKYAELTPLNFLAKNVAPENFEDTLRCIRMLLEYGASPNIPDHRDLTPLLHVLKNRKLDDHRKRELIHLFLQQKNLDMDSCREGEARIMLTKYYPELQLPAVANTIDFESLIRDIGNYDEPQFIEHFHSYQLNISEADNLSNLVQEQNTQLLLEAIKLGLHRVVDTLIEAGTNINSVHNGNTAIQIACSWGNWLALKKLLEHNQLEIRKQDHLLITVIRKLDYKESHDYVDYQKCFDLLLDSGRICINETDESGGTALHYAAHDRNANAVQKLLERGAYIGIKSSFGDLPIEAMQPDVLMQHFDNCITTNGLKCGDSNFEIIVDFKNLIPPADNEVSSRYLGTEMAPIAFFASSKEHLNLLQHPLITSFLFLKWHRLSIVFYVNFLLYSLFAISIVTHTILKFNESEHEIVTSLFGWFSWIGIAYLVARELIQISMAPTRYFRSITNYMEIALIVLSVLTCSESSYNQETQRVIAVFTMLLVSLELCLLVGSLPVLSISTHMLMLRAVSKSFLKSFTLYSIFVITFSLCFYILFGKPTVARNVATETSSNVTSYNEDFYNYEFKNCSLAAIKKGLCGDRNAPGDEEDNGEFNTFSNPLVAVIKTIVMMTGEFDAGDIKFDTLYSYLLFLLFVVFMSIVLFNLLNGLAVSDTQVIRQQAELNGSICRANLLTRYEEVLTGRSGRASFIVKHEPFRTICGRVLNLYPNYLSGRQIAILPNDSNKVMVPLPSSYEMKTLDAKTKTAATTVQSTNGLRNQKAAAFIRIPENENEREKKLLDPPVQFLPCCCSCITGKCSVMDNRTVKLAMTVIEQKIYTQRQRQHLQNTERRLQNIENMLNQVFEMLQDIQSKKANC